MSVSRLRRFTLWSIVVLAAGGVAYPSAQELYWHFKDAQLERAIVGEWKLNSHGDYITFKVDHTAIEETRSEPAAANDAYRWSIHQGMLVLEDGGDQLGGEEQTAYPILSLDEQEVVIREPGPTLAQALAQTAFDLDVAELLLAYAYWKEGEWDKVKEDFEDETYRWERVPEQDANR